MELLVEELVKKLTAKAYHSGTEEYLTLQICKDWLKFRRIFGDVNDLANLASAASNEH